MLIFLSCLFFVWFVLFLVSYVLLCVIFWVLCCGKCCFFVCCVSVRMLRTNGKCMIMVVGDLGNDWKYIQHLSDDWHIVITPAVTCRTKLKFTAWITENMQRQWALIICKLLGKVYNEFWVGEINSRLVENLIN